MGAWARAGLVAALLVLSGCEGEAELAPPLAEAQRPRGGGPGILGDWKEVSEGLPPSADLRALAHLDGTLHAVVQAGAEAALFSLDKGATAWVKGGFAPKAPGEQPQALLRFDTALFLSTADPGASKGGVYRLDYDAPGWKRLEGLPELPASALARRGSELLVALGGSGPDAGLWASSDRGQAWRKRASAVGNASFFRKPLRQLVAASAAQRSFAVGDAAAGFGGLYQSDDGGATWERSATRGDVLAVAARGVLALVCTRIDGTLRSDNYGNTWHPTSLGGDARAFALTDARAYAGTPRGVRISADVGASWSEPVGGQRDVTLLYLAGTTLFGVSQGRVFEAPLEEPR